MFKKFILIFIVVIVGVFVLFFLGSFLMNHATSNLTLSGFLKNYKIEFAIWRYSMFVLLMVFWRPLIIYWGRNRSWPKRHIINVLHLRMNIIILFVLFELIFVFNIIGWLFSLF